MQHAVRGSVVALVVAIALILPGAAAAQTQTLTIHGGGVVVSGTSVTCNVLQPCVFVVNAGAAVRLSAADTRTEAATAPAPGRFVGGTGPAAGCALSTCSFTMTADAEVSVASAPGLPIAKLTMTSAGDGGGRFRADGFPTPNNPWTVAYLQGSTVELDAEPAPGAGFAGYSSGTGAAAACGTAPHCTFTIDGDASVTGTFRALTSLSVAPSSVVEAAGGPPVHFTVTATYSDASTAPVQAGQGRWSIAPSLPSPKSGLAAAGLGGKVFALGGQAISFDPSSIADTLSAFDPATQTWTNLTSMLVRRADLSATTAGGLLYAIGGQTSTVEGGAVTTTVLASVERYDPAANAWTMRASLPAPRRALVAGSVNGIVYAAGGVDDTGTTLATLDAYDPATDTWTSRAPMSTPRSAAAAGVIDGILYVAGGRNGTSALSTMEAYDPATNTWTPKAPMPGFLGTSAAAVADGVLYVITSPGAVYAYDPVADSWSAKSPLAAALAGSSRFALAAASLNGIVYAIGGLQSAPFCCNHTVATVETFVDSLRWSSSQPAVARIDQDGNAPPRAPGTATIVANAGGQTCDAGCASFTVPGPSSLELNGPLDGSVLNAPITVIGWALNTTAPSGTGVDAVHVYAFPAGGGAPVFLGAATYGLSRPDVGAVFGSQFTDSGFSLTGGGSLAPGGYMLAIYGHNAMTGAFDVVRTVNVTIAAPVSNPFIDLDTPREGFVVTSSFEVGGWALDAGSPTGTGVDAVHLYVFPDDGAAPGVFVGQASYGLSRPDVGAIFGVRFNDTGFHYTISGLGPGAYLLGVYARSTVTGAFSIVKVVHFTVNATALMAIDAPAPEAIITAPTFDVDGWSIDRAIEDTALGGSGVDTLHVYAYPNPGSGAAPIFLGVAAVGFSRPDVAALYGPRYDTSGFHLAVDRSALGLASGVYSIVVHSHSTASNTFTNVAVVRVTLQ